jgi:O-acetylhomoserine/O-acetylserine sulfhydrylase
MRPLHHGVDIVIESGAEWLSISGLNASGVIVDSGRFDWERSQKRFPQFFEPSPGFHGLKMWEKFGKLTFIYFARAAIMRDTGPCLNPFEAFQLLAGLETLPIRMRAVSKNAQRLAKHLLSVKDVSGVNNFSTKVTLQFW